MPKTTHKRAGCLYSPDCLEGKFSETRSAPIYERGRDCYKPHSQRRIILSFLTLSLLPLRLAACLAGTFRVLFEGNSVSSHILSIVRCEQAGVVLLALAVRHPRP